MLTELQKGFNRLKTLSGIETKLLSNQPNPQISSFNRLKTLSGIET